MKTTIVLQIEFEHEEDNLPITADEIAEQVGEDLTEIDVKATVTVKTEYSE